MLIALLADIHGNREGLEAVLGAARKDGADRFVLLGDLVGYGPDPEFVVETAARMAEEGAILIKGNHDEAVSLAKISMTENARLAMVWTQARMGAAHRAILESMAVQVRDDERLYVHASAAKPLSWPYLRSGGQAVECLAATDASHVFCGHTHLPAHFHALPGKAAQVFIPLTDREIPLSSIRRSVTVIGSVGQPRDGNRAACYAMIDTRRKSVTLRRAPYNAEETLRKIKASGLPEWLGMRLLIGR